VYSSMRLGVPFIAPRQLGAVESIPGRQFLPSVDWRTGQSGAPPDTVRCGFLSYFGAADHWDLEPLAHRTQSGAHRTVRCTPDSPVPPSDRWAGHASRADCAADRWLTGQSGAPPDSPVIYSRTPPTKPESSQFARASLAHRTLSGAPPDTVQCTTGQSGAPRLNYLWLNKAISFPN
jgi:hypothetical protein